MPPRPEPSHANSAMPTVNRKWYKHKGIIAIIILTVIAGVVVWGYTLNQPQNLGAITNVINRKKLAASNSLIYPGAKLTAVKKNNDGTSSVGYETYGDNVQSFYAEQLKQLGWNKVAELGAADMTLCGGDWGGTYEKDGQKFKLHICGPDSGDFQKDISFYFYNVEPEKVLGDNLSGGTLSCVTDAKINLTSACATQDTIKITLNTQRPELNKFQVYITGEKYTSFPDVNAIASNSTVKEVDIPYDITKWGNIQKVQVTPVITSDGTFYCSEQAVESAVKTCN